jgi:hypothetical protein
MRQLMRRALLEAGVFNPLVAKLFPFRGPPILLLSYPRSGSSWVGKVLSHSPDIAYLREPMNQGCIREIPGWTSRDPDRNPDIREVYRQLSDRAFVGVPPRGIPDSIHGPEKFLPPRRGRCRLLIKEINPMAVEFFVRHWSPTVVPLLRHPGAVAESYRRLGWGADDLAAFGLSYGARMARVVEAGASGGTAPVVYEELAASPYDGYLELFARLEVRPPPDYDEVIERLCHADRDPRSPYDVRRTSSQEITKWRDGLSPDEIRDLKAGFLESPLEFYRGEEHWS